MTPDGAGKNPNNSLDPGWDAAAWNPSLPAAKTDLTTSLNCHPTYHTWTDSPPDAGVGNEDLPLNCLDWYTAEAFCIWDGGRLPTEAEWNYAATGGNQQREYPDLNLIRPEHRSADLQLWVSRYGTRHMHWVDQHRTGRLCCRGSSAVGPDGHGRWRVGMGTRLLRPV